MDGLNIILEEMKKQGKECGQINVREAMLDDIFGGKENWKSRHSELTKGKWQFFREELWKDIKKYYSDETNILEKIAIGKYWANRKLLDYDYDASDLANAVYNMAFFEGKGNIKQSHGYEYELDVDGVKYRGDTMNSWSTTINEFFRLFGGGEEGYLKGLEINDSRGKNYGKWCIPKRNPARDWVDYFRSPDNYNNKKPLPNYITTFLNDVYMIGNFIPVPYGFNSLRVMRTKDYWDLTLLRIYKWYMAAGDEMIQNDELHNLLCENGNVNVEEAIHACKMWLTYFATWQDFVEKNFLQDFVNITNGLYGFPKELWPGHFSGPLLPATKAQMEAFCTNASSWVLARGNRMMISLKEKLGEEIGK